MQLTFFTSEPTKDDLNKILEALTKKPQGYNEIAAITNLSKPKVIQGLLLLELKGLAHQIYHESYILSSS